MSRTFNSSRPCQWVHPRPHTDASLRFMKHGKVQPMEGPSLTARIFAWARGLPSALRSPEAPDGR